MHVNTSFKPYSEGLQATVGPMPVSSSYMDVMASSSTNSYQYPSAYTAQSIWDHDALSSSTDMSWAGEYESIPTTTATTTTTTTTTAWAPSVNPYTTYATTTSQAVPATSDLCFLNDGGFFPAYPGSIPTTMSSEGWSRPSITRSVSADNATNLTAYGSSSSSRMASTAPVTPTEYQVSPSEYSSTQTIALPKPKPKTTPKAGSKKRDSSSLKTKKDKEPLKRKFQPQITPAPILTTQKAVDDYLISRFGLPLPDNARHLSSEEIRREAWRVCESQAKEMSERRMKLLEHEGGALERETRRLQLNVGLLRESILQEQRQLENALEIAERLSSSSY